MTEVQRAAALRLETKKKALDDVRARADAAIAEAVAGVERAERVCKACEDETVATALYDVLHDEVERVRRADAEDARIAADLADGKRADDLVQIYKLEPDARAKALARWEADPTNASWLVVRLADPVFAKVHYSAFDLPAPDKTG